MSKGYHRELKKLSQTKNIISLLPERFRFRVAKKLYDYESESVVGIDIVAPLQDDGVVCFINTKDLIGWKIFFFGEYEGETNRILAKHIKKGDVVIEAGANMGSETLLLSGLVGDGHVYAFEPNPYTFDRLKINVSINELRNVSIYEWALGEKNGEISFNIFPKTFCNPGMSSKYIQMDNTRKIDVIQKTIDSFVQENNVKKVDFIKMDIQGGEMDAILGANDTIAKFMPTIFAEASTHFSQLNELYDKIKGYGYDIYLIGGNDMELMATVSNIKAGNWLAIKNK